MSRIWKTPATICKNLVAQASDDELVKLQGTDEEILAVLESWKKPVWHEAYIDLQIEHLKMKDLSKIRKYAKGIADNNQYWDDYDPRDDIGATT